MIDAKICERARKARDARFDGRFFTGVRTTGIYCRPVCPARPPKEENVEYFATAAAASGAGYRPCLRCRPEAAPGTPAWTGTPALVARALRLISESALDEHSTEHLAARLGIGSRHLRRLFMEHLGAPPATIAQTRRTQFAKQLIDSTPMPFTDVAMAAGFGSIRRFNTLVQQTYHRSPTQLRALAPKVAAACRFNLTTRPPFAWRELLDFLAARATPGLDQVEDDTFTRRFRLDGKDGVLTARLHDGGVEVAIDFPDSRRYLMLIERVRRLFDLNADPLAVQQQLCTDPGLRPIVHALPGIRVPGCWDGFELAVRAILGQQVTVRGATTLAGRLVEKFGVPDPAVLAEADVAEIGLPQPRAEAIRGLARATLDGRVRFDGTVEEFMDALTSLPGLGAWTAQYIAMRAFGEPDAFPSSDLVLLKQSGIPSAKQLEQRAEHWRPWRAYAALYLWQGARYGLRMD